jgi:hypothetical protein
MVTAAAMVIVLLLWGEPFRDSLNRLLGIRSWSGAGRTAATGALTVLVLAALIIALDPEVRGILLLVDALGVDIFLMLLAFQGRECLLLLYGTLALPVARRLSAWGPYPTALPSRWLMRTHPFWGVYTTLQLVAVATLSVIVMSGVTWGVGNVLGGLL